LSRSQRRPVLLVACETGDQAVLVESLLEGRELATKRLSPLVPRIPGLLAASVLGDGRVAPIVDLPTILTSAAGADWSVTAAGEATDRVRLPTVLVVDDSLSMRRVLTQLVADAGYRPLAARDGMEAIRTLAREPVDLILVDMEMPQMNGLELTAHVRAQTDTGDMPIAMITSRSAERHRREALRVGVDRYFVKPYRDDEVLDFIHRTLEQAQ
jgi:chemosensory pili system protein ChpA (sensor histidine kinase/response regulator)